MNNDNLPRSEWYTPRAQAAPAAPRSVTVAVADPRRTAYAPYPPYPPTAQRKKHTGLKITAIAVFVLLVLVASVYVFSDGLNWSVRQEDTDDSHSFTFEIPDPDRSGDESGKKSADSPAELPENYDKDYKDFFSKYYSGGGAAKSEYSGITRGETGAGFRVELQSAEELPELTLQELYTRCVDSVVGIKATMKGKLGYYWGTGIVMSEDGYILTNQHIIAGTDNASVILPDGRELDALLIGEDAQMDIAVLKIEASGLRPAAFGDSSALCVGDSVVAIGNPLTDSLSGTMTNGIVSAIDRSVSSNGHPMTLIQTNAALNEGNSGGPLFNMYGQVVGITNMKMSNPYSDVTVEGLGFAIPSATVKAVTDQLFATGHYVRPGIGITVGPIDAEDAAHYGLPGGLYISSVSPMSDAAKKGVQEGDILTHVNGVAVRKTDDVLAIRDAMQIGDTMTLTIYRDGETLEIEIELYNLSELY